MMNIKINVMDDQADYLAKQWLLAHYRMTLEFMGTHDKDIEYNENLIRAIETVFDYMGEPNNVIAEWDGMDQD
jgi:hypothetical protein